MFRNRKHLHDAPHLRDDYRPPASSVPWHREEQANTIEHVGGADHRRSGLTTLQALEVIRLRYEAAQRDAQHQQAA